MAKGYPTGVMPQDFATIIKPKELDALVEYLIASTSKGGSSSAKGKGG